MILFNKNRMILSNKNRINRVSRLLPAFLILAYWSILLALKGLTREHLAIGILILVLNYSSSKLKAFRKFAMPFLLTAILYDSQRFYGDWIRGPIHVREPYEFDLRFFGISVDQRILTPNEWWQLHLHPALDLITGFAYLVFFLVFILFAAYFTFFLKNRLKERKTPMDYRVPWAFFWVNLLGYSNYYWYAAAPPWYVSQYGLGPARLDVSASSAGCARFDQLLGTHFFSEMYGRAADVFGAIPSLHVAYPLLAAYFAFYFGSARFLSIAFYLLMCFSAVYLNHHYVLDVLCGSFYALLTGWGINRFYDHQPKSVRSRSAFLVPGDVH